MAQYFYCLMANVSHREAQKLLTLMNQENDEGIELRKVFLCRQHFHNEEYCNEIFDLVLKSLYELNASLRADKNYSNDERLQAIGLFLVCYPFNENYYHSITNFPNN